MVHPSASAHRSKDWESFQCDIQKKTVNLPRGRSDMLPLISPSHGGWLSFLGLALPLCIYSVLSLFLLFAAFNVGTEKTPAYLLNLLLAMECSSRFGEKALHYAVYEMSNSSTWRYFLSENSSTPGIQTPDFRQSCAPKGGGIASNLDINKCTESKVTFHKSVVFLSKREIFFSNVEKCLPAPSPWGVLIIFMFQDKLLQRRQEKKWQ